MMTSKNPLMKKYNVEFYNEREALLLLLSILETNFGPPGIRDIETRV